MNSLTRFHVPATESMDEHHVDLCENHRTVFEANLKTLAAGGVLPGRGSEDERRDGQKNVREMVQQRSLAERVEIVSSPEGAACIMCTIPVSNPS